MAHIFSWIVLMVTCVLPSIVAHNNSCCEPDHLLMNVRNKEGAIVKLVCWERISNSTKSSILTCTDTVKVRSKHYVNDEGHLVLQTMANSEVVVNSGEYCLHQRGNSTANTTIVLCIDKEDEDNDVVDDSVKGYCMIVSVVFLILTAAVYTALPELRDLLGKSLISFCGSMSIGLIILIIMKLMEYSNMALCATRGFLAYFFIVSSFFWSNAMAIQIMISMRRSCLYDGGWKEYLWYALYSWGCPAVLTIIIAIINFHPGDHPKPGIGLMHCWFVGNQHWYYMYSVMSVLILINIAIFIWTLSSFWCLSFHSTHIKATKYKLLLTMRLFILMGVPWIFEMISSLVDENIVWAIIDIFNTLQGLLIFILLVVLRKRVLKMMLKHGWLDCMSGLVEKHLALAEDEEDVVEHTTDVRMEDKIMT
ncbi:putative G-protein coupled receptor Mth-like 3 [Aphomia sociella]